MFILQKLFQVFIKNLTDNKKHILLKNSNLIFIFSFHFRKNETISFENQFQNFVHLKSIRHKF